MKISIILILSMLSFTSCSKEKNRFEDEPLIEYTLSYVSNGGKGNTPKAVKALEGTYIIIHDGVGMNLDNHSFTCWNTKPNGTGIDILVGIRYIINSDITLYAKWSEKTMDSNSITITVGANKFVATLANNATSNAFKAQLPLTIRMSDMNSNEKYATLSGNLPTASFNSGTINNGDIMLYGSSTLVIFYKSFSTSYSYTTIGKIENPTSLQSLLGRGDVTVKFEIN